MNKVFVLLPVHNRQRITLNFIECLRLQTYTNFHLVLIDDGSTDGTAAMVQAAMPDATILTGTGKWWWAGSLQKGIDWLKTNKVLDSDIVLFINDDVAIKPNYLAEAVAFIHDKPGILVLSKFCSGPENKIEESGVIADLMRLSFRHARANEEVNCLSTRGLFLHFGDVKTIGDFHPRVLPHYLSDYEYTIRAIRKGMRCKTNDPICLYPIFELTGYHSFENLGFPDFLRQYFSTKSSANPFYWSSFVVLTVPWQWLLPNLMRVWHRAIRIIIRQFLTKFKDPKASN